MNMDPPEHAKYRDLVNRRFTPRAVRALEAEVSEIAERTMQQHSLIVVDDLHDADHPSLLMHRFIACQTKDPRILMVGTYRDTEVRQSPELSKLSGDLTREDHSIPTAELTENDRLRIGPHRFGHDFGQRLNDRTEHACDPIAKCIVENS
jgi:hypothetical protein